MDEKSIKHLELVQGVINRIANNSFFLKGWTITLTAALFTLAAKDSNRTFAILALFPALAFWGLDAYYLRMERRFRRLYEKICSSNTGSPVPPFSMAINNCNNVDSWFLTLFSPTIVYVHGIVIALILAVTIGLPHLSRLFGTIQ